MLADADRLRQALVIVLDNAVRYSARGTTVRIGLQGMAGASGASGVGEVAVVVHDEGIGIDADDLPRVFERFVRGRRARAHRADGTGIGLSIAQAIVQAHQGRVDIASVPQQGTVVRIVLPLVAASPPDAAQAAGVQPGALA